MALDNANATSTIPATILALLEKFAGLTWPATLGGTDPLVVFDGIPGPTAPDNYILVGGRQTPAVVASTAWANLGAQRREEDYTVECLISCAAGGSADAGDYGLMDAQRTARQNVFAVFAVIETALRADLRLLTVADPPNIMWLEVLPKDLEQTGEADPGAANGRVATLLFDVHVIARI